MRSRTIHTIYGQRFPIEANNFVAHARADWSMPELPVQDLRRLSGCESNVVPVLNIDAFVRGELSDAQLAEVVALGPEKIVISIDEDSEAIRSLSPRFHDEDARDRAAASISDAIRIFSKGRECVVALTVEELCPGGLDPTEGIALAQRFVEAGACAIIASGGTMDFPPLKFRRQTTLNQERQEGKDIWPETWLSSAMWLVGRVNVPVYAQGLVSNLDNTLVRARELGLAGVIDVSLKYPSSF
jgi:hypothetical protein